MTDAKSFLAIKLYPFDFSDEPKSCDEITPHKFIFELLPRKNDIVPPNMNPQEQLNWLSMYANEHPIRILEIDGSQYDDGYAIAYSHTLESSEPSSMKRSFSKLLKLEIERDKIDTEDYGKCSILHYIRFAGKTYAPSPNEYAVLDQGSKIPDGSIHLQFSQSCDIQSTIVKIMNKPTPYMDETGTFHYKAKILAREDPSGKWVKTDTNATVFISGCQCQAILDQDKHLIYSVKSEKMFRKIRKL